jgi:hypothetical protein
MRRFYDTTAPTKEGLLRDTKIVSNLQDEKRRPGLPHGCGKCQIRPDKTADLAFVRQTTALGITGIRLYGVPFSGGGTWYRCRPLLST